MNETYQAARLLKEGLVDIAIGPSDSFTDTPNVQHLYEWHLVVYPRTATTISIAKLGQRELLTTPQHHTSRGLLDGAFAMEGSNRVCLSRAATFCRLSRWQMPVRVLRSCRRTRPKSLALRR